jgi:hypothetical protein
MQHFQPVDGLQSLGESVGQPAYFIKSHI